MNSSTGRAIKFDAAPDEDKSKGATRVAEKKENQFIDADRFLDTIVAKTGISQPSEEIKEEFDEAARLASSGSQLLQKDLQEHHSKSPILSGGDIDAAWDRADVGEETVGGSVVTPDQDVVDQLGEAVGLVYEDNEPLDTEEKIAKRDLQRWELNPASSEDYEKRLRQEGEYEGE